MRSATRHPIRIVLPSILALATLVGGCAAERGVLMTPGDAPTLVREAQTAYQRGDYARAIARAHAAIAQAPGHALLADAQLLLARSYDRRGALKAAWDQYRLFVANFARHPSADGALARAAALARQHPEWFVAHPISRWSIVSLPRIGQPLSLETQDELARHDLTGVIVALGHEPDWRHLAVVVDRAALQGLRVLLWAPLAQPSESFDPFDAHALARMAERFRTAARLPVDGFLVGRDLFRATGGVHPNDRAAWQRVGLGARASAVALGRFIATVESVRPGRLWIVAVSALAAELPVDAVARRGEDLAELHRHAPGAWLLMVGATRASRPTIQSAVSAIGVPASALLWMIAPGSEAMDGASVSAVDGLEP